jgi:hypothetical protein
MLLRHDHCPERTPATHYETPRDLRPAPARANRRCAADNDPLFAPPSSHCQSRPTRRRGIRLAAVFFAAVALIFVACGSGGSNDDATATAQAPAASRTFGPEAPTPVIPPSQVAVNRVSGLQSYFFTVVLEAQGPTAIAQIAPNFVPRSPTQTVTIQAGGQYVAPDKALLSVKNGSQLQSETIIGTQSWQVFNGQPNTPRTVDPQAALRLPLVVGIWDVSGIIGVFGGFKCGSEVTLINDYPTHRCDMDPLFFRSVHTRLTSLFNLSYAREVGELILYVHLSEDGYPIRLVFTATGRDEKRADFRIHMQMDVLRLNEPADIQPPRTS